MIAVFLAVLLDDFKDAAARLSRAMASRDYAEIKKAIKDLPASDERTPKFLIDSLRTADWWTKGRIVAALEKHPAVLLQEVENRSRRDVREACALALGAVDQPEAVAALAKALADADWRVRRAAAIALGTKVSRERIDALVARLAEEKDRGVQVHLLSRLESWTGKRMKPADWAAWWKAHREDKLDPQAAQKGEVAFEGFTLKHETVALENARVGIVVLPEYAARPDHFRPYLDFLSAWGNVHYLRLPDPKDLATEKTTKGTPIYPVDRMVGALEELRTGFREERLVLVAQGLTAWLAMAYAQKHPEGLAGLLLLGANADEDSYLASAGRAKSEAVRKKDAHLEALASYYQGNFTDWTTGHTVAEISEFAADPQDLILSRVLENYWEDYGGAVVIPDVRQRFKAGVSAPALFVFGRHDAFSGLPEFGRAQKYFPAATAAVFDGSGVLPYLTEPEKFEKAVSDFLTRVLKKR